MRSGVAASTARRSASAVIGARVLAGRRSHGLPGHHATTFLRTAGASLTSSGGGGASSSGEKTPARSSAVGVDRGPRSKAEALARLAPQRRRVGGDASRPGRGDGVQAGRSSCGAGAGARGRAWRAALVCRPEAGADAQVGTVAVVAEHLLAVPRVVGRQRRLRDGPPPPPPAAPAATATRPVSLPRSSRSGKTPRPPPARGICGRSMAGDGRDRPMNRTNSAFSRSSSRRRAAGVSSEAGIQPAICGDSPCVPWPADTPVRPGPGQVTVCSRRWRSARGRSGSASAFGGARGSGTGLTAGSCAAVQVVSCPWGGRVLEGEDGQPIGARLM